ncbi:hypothetical protein [Vibrio sp. CB1-14]|uniref:Uncharacterized protein n=1 Tax=Vibrio chaetopteri TaxID=3016528 RepID=A0AAU8BLB3_9VIBR
MKEVAKKSKPKSTLRGLKIVISDSSRFTREELDQLRYAIAKVLIKFGDKKILPSFCRATGITIDYLQNQFGNTIYLASKEERRLAKEMLDNLQPKAMDGAITLSSTYKEVSEEQFKRRLYTVRTHIA